MGQDRLSGRGLPSRLPNGERLLWQGKPDAVALARHAFRAPLLGVYFGIILLASAVVARSHGADLHAMTVSLLHRAGLAAVPLALIAVYAWATSASTTYSITSRRVVVQCGMALPVSFNIPFARIDAAGLRLHRRGAGDIALSLQAGDRMSYFALWPNVRPWHLAQTEPMLRCLAGAGEVSAILANALAGHAQAEAAVEAAPARDPVREPAMVSQAETAMAD